MVKVKEIVYKNAIILEWTVFVCIFVAMLWSGWGGINAAPHLIGEGVDLFGSMVSRLDSLLH